MWFKSAQKRGIYWAYPNNMGKKSDFWGMFNLSWVKNGIFYP